MTERASYKVGGVRSTIARSAADARALAAIATWSVMACVGSSGGTSLDSARTNPDLAAPESAGATADRAPDTTLPPAVELDAAIGGRGEERPPPAASGSSAPPPASEAGNMSATDRPSASPAMPAPAAQNPMPQPPPPKAEPEFWPEDCEARYAFNAHGVEAPGDRTKYRVSPGAQHLVVFRFELPWRGDVQMLAAKMIFDNTKVVHHWTLFAIDEPSVRDGEIIFGLAQANLITLVDAIPLMSVGPGATDMQLPADVGLRIPSVPNAAFALEVHYFNLGDTVEEDASGVELCVTSKKRPQVAAMHSLGRIAFALPPRQRTEVSSTCRPVPTQRTVQLQGAIPHMHGAGRHAKLTVTRAAGDVVTLIDAPYDAQEQRTYLLSANSEAPFVLQPGDTLTTHCAFDNATDSVILAGARIEDEMCTMMVLAWPTGVLTNGLTAGVFGVPDDSTCMEF